MTWNWAAVPTQPVQLGGNVGSLKEASTFETWPSYDAAYLAKRLGSQNPTAAYTDKYGSRGSRDIDGDTKSVFQGMSREAKEVYLDRVTRDFANEADECLKQEFKEWLQGTHEDNDKKRYYPNLPGQPKRRNVYGPSKGGGGGIGDTVGQDLTEWTPTWWGKSSLTHLDGVREFLKQDMQRADDQSLFLNLLAEHGPQNIEQAWAYFKHWVKGRPLSEAECIHKPGEIDDTHRAPAFTIPPDGFYKTPMPSEFVAPAPPPPPTHPTAVAARTLLDDVSTVAGSNSTVAGSSAASTIAESDNLGGWPPQSWEMDSTPYESWIPVGYPEPVSIEPEDVWEEDLHTDTYEYTQQYGVTGVEVPATPTQRQKAKMDAVLSESVRDLEDEVRRVERGRGKIPALVDAQNKLEKVMGGPSRPRTSVKAAIENAASAMYGVVTPERSARFRKGKEEFVRSVNAAPVKMLLTAMRNVTTAGLANFESEMAAAGGFADVSDDMRSGTFEDDWEDATIPLYESVNRNTVQYPTEYGFSLNVAKPVANTANTPGRPQWSRPAVRRNPSRGKRVSASPLVMQ